MKAIGTIIGLSLVGTIGTALVMFIYRAYELISQGVPRDQMPFQQLIVDEMRLHEFALLGAAGGAAFAVVVILLSLIVGLVRGSGGRSTSAPSADPDSIIRSRRAAIADDYLAQRREQSDHASAL